MRSAGGLASGIFLERAGPLLPYWLLFAYFAAGALLTGDRRASSQGVSRVLLAVGAVAIALLIGLRYRVGADWRSYEFMFSYAGLVPLERAIAVGDPAYQFVNWTVNALGGELWHVNLVCGAIFAWGLLRFVRAQSAPWLAMLIAIPYLVVVVAMGYSRQAVAIGIILAGLGALLRGASIPRFALYVAAAALFHKTAVIVMALVMFAAVRNRLLNVLIAAVAVYLMYNVFLADSVDRFVADYIERAYASQGAAIRVAMSVVPAALFLVSRQRFNFTKQEERLWLYFSLGAIGCLIALVLSPSSTAVDRLALYLLPLQIAILARLPAAYSRFGFGAVVVVAMSFAILFVWLNYAVHARYWVPYRFYPIG